MKRFFSTIVLFGLLGLALPVSGVMNPGEFKSYFDNYLGVWEGEFHIKTTRNEPLNSFDVRRSYWWEDQALKGRVAYIFDDGESVSDHRIILSDWTPFTFISTPHSPEAILFALKGEVARGTTTWSKMLPKGSLPTQLNEKIVVEADGRTVMKLWGEQEATDSSGKAVLVRIEGSLNRVALKTEPLTVPVNTEVESAHATAAEALQSELQPEEVPVPPVSEPDLSEASVVEESAPILPVAAPAEKSPIQLALEQVPIVGIRETQRGAQILVDFHGLVRAGQGVPGMDNIFFDSMDETFLLFKDLEGTVYSIPRKDRDSWTPANP